MREFLRQVLPETIHALSDRYSNLLCTLLMTDLLNEILMKPQVPVTSLGSHQIPGVTINQSFSNNLFEILCDELPKPQMLIIGILNSKEKQLYSHH